METPGYVSIPFYSPITTVNTIFLGNIHGYKWSLHLTSFEIDPSTFELKFVEIVRCASNESVDVELTISQWDKIHTSLIWQGKKMVHFDKDQNLGKFFPKDFTRRVSKRDFLQGVVTIFDHDDRAEARRYLNYEKYLSNGSEKLADDLSNLLEADDSYSDAVLKCDGAEFPVHKCILATRCPQFAAIFRNKMAEALSSVVVIEDINMDILNLVLKYLYTGRIPDFPNALAGDLLYAAEKYDLPELKRVCVGKLKSSLTVDNVFEVLVVGHLHDESLKRHAKQFICDHREFSKLEDTEHWKLLVGSRPELAIEVLTFVVKHHEISKSK